MAHAQGGDTNIVILLGTNSSARVSTPQRLSLKGKPLPDLAPLGLSLEATPEGKRLLVCLFDQSQRPSRRYLKLLTEQQEALRAKGVSLLAIQAAAATPEAWQEWKAANPVPFPVGQVTEKSDAIQWISAESLPYLILTDAEHRVAAEAFQIEDLDAKLK